MKKIEKLVLLILLISGVGHFAQSSFPYTQEWGTYVGGAGTHLMNTTHNMNGGILFDSNDNIVVGGEIMARPNFDLPYYNQFAISSNSYPFIMGNTFNIFTSEFSPGGQLTASAYWGMNGVGGEHLMHIDKQDNRYVVKNLTGLVNGLSTSGVWLSGFTNTAFSQTSAIYTRVLTKYDASGNAVWTTYLPNLEGTNIQLVTDSGGNIYLCGDTFSDIPEIGTPGVYQEHFLNYTGNFRSSYIVKLNSSGQKVWGTFFPTGIFRLRVYDDGGIYFIAHYSADCPVVPTTAGAFQPTDASRFLIMKFDADTGQRVWGTFYGHPLSQSYFEDIRELRINESGIYVLGYVMSPNGSDSYYATPGCYQPQMKGSGDMHLSKFDASSGNRIWATYFGGNGDEEMFASTNMGLSDSSILFAGVNYGSGNMATPGAFLASPPNPVNYGNMYFSEFSLESGDLIYCSYFGGPDLPGSIINASFDNIGNLYLYGYTTAMTGIATPNGYYNTAQQPAPGGNTFGFLTKFSKQTMAVSNAENTSDLVLYDNPNNGTFTLSGSTLEKKNCRLQIFDSTGRLVSNKKLEKNKIQKFDMKGVLVHGVYYLHIQDEKDTTLKVFKMTVK